MPAPRTRPWLVGIAVLGLTAAGTAALTTTAGAAPAVFRASVSTTGEQGNGFSGPAVISGDGRYVAFSSIASNLAANDPDSRQDVFVHDRFAGTTELVSVGITGAPGSGLVNDISHDGRYVVFTSTTADLVVNDFNGVSDVFLRDRVLGTTERVSIADDEAQAQAASLDASVSRDGRYVTFTSFAPLVDADRDLTSRDVYVRDRVAGTTELVSVTRQGNEGGGQEPSVSDGGRFIAFTSKGGKLVKGDKNKKHDIFVRDLLKDRTELISVSSQGDQGRKSSAGSEIAGAGRFVVFSSTAGNLVKGDKNKKQDIFVHDRNKDRTEIVSIDSRERVAGGPSRLPSISANGRYVVFNSAVNLRKGGRSTDTLYLRDRQDDRTDRLVQEVGQGAVASADGHTLSFLAFRGDLVTGDTNSTTDTFVYTW